MASKKLGGKNQIGLPARRTAVKFIKKILRDKKSLDELFSDNSNEGPLESLSSRDRALVRQICATILRRHGQLNKKINKHLEKPLPRKSGDAWEILLCGAVQILFLNVPVHAAIDLSVRLASYDRNAKHFKGLINAVLRKVSEQAQNVEEDISVNIPEWLLTRWQQQYTQEEILKIANQHLETPPLDITCKDNPELWAEKLNAEILPSGSLRVRNAGKIQNLPGFSEGAWWVQDVAASLPVKLLGNIEGKQVLDICAAPGGKTMQLANAGAHVISIDQSDKRLKLLTENLERTHLSAEIISQDATHFKPSTPPDIILLDAPCSATGTLRRHPDLPYIKDSHMISNLLDIQRRLLSHSSKILKSGGKLIYCTCSLEQAEGENQIEQFLKENSNFKIDTITPNEVWDIQESIRENGVIRTLPFYYGDKGGMDGFFIARLEKSTP